MNSRTPSSPGLKAARNPGVFKQGFLSRVSIEIGVGVIFPIELKAVGVGYAAPEDLRICSHEARSRLRPDGALNGARMRYIMIQMHCLDHGTAFTMEC